MKKNGFAPADIISLGIILLILGFVAVPHVKAGRLRAREAQTRTNMHTLQLTAEGFATLADGVYPTNLETTVEDACGPCTGDQRRIADVLMPFYDSNSLLPDNFINPFNPTYDALANGDGTGLSGRVNYFDFGSIANTARGYSIRGVGADDSRYLTLVLTSYR